MKIDLSQIIDADGKILLDTSEIRKIERNIKIKKWMVYRKYFSAIEIFLTNLPSDEYIYLPYALFIETLRFQENCGQCLTIIRTLNIKFPKLTFFDKISVMIQGFLDLSSNLSSQIAKSRDFEIPPDLSQINFSEDNFRDHRLISSFHHNPTIWRRAQSILKVPYQKNLPLSPYLYIFHEAHTIEQLFSSSNSSGNMLLPSFQQISESSSGLDRDLITDSNSEISTFQIPEIFSEFLFFLYQNDNIIIDLNAKSSKGDGARKSEKMVEDMLSEYLVQYLGEQITSRKIRLSSPPPNSLPLNELQHQFNIHISWRQEELTKLHDGDLIVISQDLQKEGTVLFTILESLEVWLKEKQTFLPTVKRPFKTIRVLIGQIRGNIAQTLDDFDQYARSIREDRHKMELEKILETNVQDLESHLRNYQMTTTPFIESSMPDLDKLITIIQQYKQNFIDMRSKITEIFREFKDKGVNVAPLMDEWTGKYEEVTNRASFTLRNTLTTIFSKFNTVLETEQEFFESVTGFSPNSNFSSFQSVDFLQPEKLSESDLRDRISKMDTKLSEFNNIRRRYLEERDKYSNMLEDLLKNSGLESKKCIICHKNVDIINDHYVKCEFCGSMSHYTCAVWWLDRYNSCPVCYNKYTIPNNELFDPDQMVK
ncbi:MAG: hypothetical protein ACTSVZ_07695 [Promethearchaeota archaeon]